MNGKRIAAIIGLIGMGVCILSMVLGGVFPAFKDLFWMVGMMAFMVAVSISLFFAFRKQEEQQNQPEEEQTEEPEENP